jgi:hypothetical protein
MQAEIDRQNKYFADRRTLLPEIQTRLNDLKVKLDSFPNDQSSSRIPRANIEFRIGRFERVIRDIVSGREEFVFKRKIQPFMEANRTMIFDRSVVGEHKVKRKRKASELSKHLVQKTSLTKTEMLAEYLTLFGGSADIPQIDSDDSCPLCGEQMVVVDRKAQATCTRCGFCQQHMDATTANVQYNCDMEFSNFSYKRVNHFNDWMAQIQARESGEVKKEDLDSIMAELYAQRVMHPSQITIKLVRAILKKLKIRKAYDHVTQIVCRLTGEPPPRLHPHLEECCRIMFIQIQPSFEKHKGERKNMLSYSYTLFKFLQLLGVENIPLLHFSLLKGKDKLEKQDVIFRKICGDLDWQFIPSRI